MKSGTTKQQIAQLALDKWKPLLSAATNNEDDNKYVLPKWVQTEPLLPHYIYDKSGEETVRATT